MYLLKAATKKAGRFDPEAFAAAKKGVSLPAKDQPSLLMALRFDQHGDLDWQSRMVRVENGWHVINVVPPPIGRK